jgi:hypothetical protein
MHPLSLSQDVNLTEFNSVRSQKGECPYMDLIRWANAYQQLLG